VIAQSAIDALSGRKPSKKKIKIVNVSIGKGGSFKVRKGLLHKHLNIRKDSTFRPHDFVRLSSGTTQTPARKRVLHSVSAP
jgi:hypothetical protein